MKEFLKNNKGDRSIVFFGAKAPGWSQLLKKGKEVVVESRLQQCSWVIPEGIHKSKAELWPIWLKVVICQMNIG